MESTITSLAAALRADAVHYDGVSKFAPNRRFATIFTEGSPADSLLYVESGLVKLSKRGDENKEIILDIVGPGQLFGEHALAHEGVRNVSAELLQEGVIYTIPREVFIRFCDERPKLWRLFSESLVAQKKELEKKIELLCLHDVEFRILYYLRHLAPQIGAKLSTQEYSIPLSQGELASLIGATRETTSTTLNALARRGLIRLGRRQLIVVLPSETEPVPQNFAAGAGTNGSSAS